MYAGRMRPLNSYVSGYNQDNKFINIYLIVHLQHLFITLVLVFYTSTRGALTGKQKLTDLSCEARIRHQTGYHHQFSLFGIWFFLHFLCSYFSGELSNTLRVGRIGRAASEVLHLEYSFPSFMSSNCSQLFFYEHSDIQSENFGL
jgi:hypothetical protein